MLILVNAVHLVCLVRFVTIPFLGMPSLSTLSVGAYYA